MKEVAKQWRIPWKDVSNETVREFWCLKNEVEEAYYEWNREHPDDQLNWDVD
jgi:hypothetical protein